MITKAPVIKQYVHEFYANKNYFWMKRESMGLRLKASLILADSLSPLKNISTFNSFRNWFLVILLGNEI